MASCDDPLGCLPPGAFWVGETPWEEYDFTAWSLVNDKAHYEPTASQQDIAEQKGSIYVGNVLSEQRPDGPHQAEHAAVMFINGTKGAGGTGERYIGYGWKSNPNEAGAVDQSGQVLLHLGGGDTHAEAAIEVIGNGNTVYVLGGEIWGEDWILVADFYGGQVRGKAWKVGEAEPPWTVQVPAGTGNPDYSRIEMLAAAQTGDSIDVDEIQVGFDAFGGTWAANILCGIGDGSASAFTTPAPFVPGTLSVRVDGLIVEPIIQTADLGLFYLDRAPDVGARITASYQVA